MNYYTSDKTAWQRLRVCIDTGYSVYYGKIGLPNDEPFKILQNWFDKNSNTVKLIAQLYTVTYCITFDPYRGSAWMQEINIDVSKAAYISFLKEK